MKERTEKLSVASIKNISLLEIVIWVERSWSDVSVKYSKVIVTNFNSYEN